MKTALYAAASVAMLIAALPALYVGLTFAAIAPAGAMDALTRFAIALGPCAACIGAACTCMVQAERSA